MPNDYTDLSRVFQLLTRVMTDSDLNHLNCPPKTIVYLVSQTEDNGDSVLDRAGDFVATVRRAAMLKTAVVCGYPGFDRWFNLMGGNDENFGDPMTTWKFLELHEVPNAQEFEEKGQANTLTEMIGLARTAKERGWKQVILISAPFHQLRSFVTLVSVARTVYPKLKVYNAVGCEVDWQEKVIHSQGKATGTRVEILMRELENIQKYHQKGDLLGPDEILDYLNKRDS